MEMVIDDKKYTIEQCFELLGIKREEIVESDDDKYLDANGNYSYSFDLKTDTPNQVVNFAVSKLNV